MNSGSNQRFSTLNDREYQNMKINDPNNDHRQSIQIVANATPTSSFTSLQSQQKDPKLINQLPKYLINHVQNARGHDQPEPSKSENSSEQAK